MTERHSRFCLHFYQQAILQKLNRAQADLVWQEKVAKEKWGDRMEEATKEMFPPVHPYRGELA